MHHFVTSASIIAYIFVLWITASSAFLCFFVLHLFSFCESTASSVFLLGFLLSFLIYLLLIRFSFFHCFFLCFFSFLFRRFRWFWVAKMIVGLEPLLVFFSWWDVHLQALTFRLGQGGLYQSAGPFLLKELPLSRFSPSVAGVWLLPRPARLS